MPTISTRTPHAGSDHGLEQRDLLLRISTRTPHAGSDVVLAVLYSARVIFQPALPMRGVTYVQTYMFDYDIKISTRTPHAGSDYRYYVSGER